MAGLSLNEIQYHRTNHRPLTNLDTDSWPLNFDTGLPEADQFHTLCQTIGSW